MFGQVHPTPYDICFRIFKIPVRINPFFWLIMALLGMTAIRNPADAIAWIGAALISILAHELGHALTMRAYGYWPKITLYGFGGVTSRDSNAYGARRSTMSEILTIVAGPAVGFAIYGILYGVVHLVPLDTYLDYVNYRIKFEELSFQYKFLVFMLFINLFWSILNVMPVLPLDGGQLTREILKIFFPHQGFKATLIISVVTSALVAFCAFRFLGQWYLMLLFIMLGVQNFMMLKAYERGARY